jgi:hypothetical protein
MKPDPVVAEVRAIREPLAARLTLRLDDTAKQARQRDAAGDRNAARLPPRRPIEVGAVTHQSKQGDAADSRSHPATWTFLWPRTIDRRRATKGQDTR